MSTFMTKKVKSASIRVLFSSLASDNSDMLNIHLNWCLMLSAICTKKNNFLISECSSSKESLPNISTYKMQLTIDRTGKDCLHTLLYTS